MKTRYITLIVLLGATLLAAFHLMAAPEPGGQQVYEYATVRFMGDETSISWADGSDVVMKRAVRK